VLGAGPLAWQVAAQPFSVQMLSPTVMSEKHWGQSSYILYRKGLRKPRFLPDFCLAILFRNDMMAAMVGEDADVPPTATRLHGRADAAELR
jgi:hypothetical protein